MKLSIKERLLIGDLYPKEGNIMEQTMVRDMAGKTAITQEEMDQVNFRASDNGFVWDSDKAEDVEVEFTDAELDVLRGSVDKLDREKKVTQDNLDLCRKIKGI